MKLNFKLVFGLICLLFPMMIILNVSAVSPSSNATSSGTSSSSSSNASDSESSKSAGANKSKKDSSSKSSTQKNNKTSSGSTLLPKTKTDDSKELDPNELQLNISSDSSDDGDFGFIQNEKNTNGSIEWMKTMGIVLIVLACVGFAYSIFGLIVLRKKYKNKI